MLWLAYKVTVGRAQKKKLLTIQNELEQLPVGAEVPLPIAKDSQ